MSNVLGAVLDAYREAMHITEWTGLSLGLLAGLALLVYLDPALRKIAIRGGIGIIVGYILLMYGNHVGSADKGAEWQAANARMAAEEKLRDKAAANDAAAAEAQEAGVLNAQQQTDQEQINALRNSDAACHPITGDQLR